MIKKYLLGENKNHFFYCKKKNTLMSKKKRLIQHRRIENCGTKTCSKTCNRWYVNFVGAM